MFKEHLFTPGPTEIPLRILKAMERPTIHHRTSIFKGEFRQALDGLKWLTNSKTDPIMLSATGSGAMEAAMLNLVSPGKKILVLNGGKFGERWSLIGARLGLSVVELKAHWGDSINASELEAALDKHPDIELFCAQYSETSTAVLHPLPELLKVVRAKAPNAITVIDVVSALGTLPIIPDELGIDVLVGASQKALMLPPGLSFLFLNDRAWSVAQKVPRRSLYFDLLIEKKYHEQDTTAWTPAITLILGLNEAVRMLREEGLDKVYNRHLYASNALRAALKAIGLEILGDRFPSPSVTAAFTPEGIDAEDLRSDILKHTGVRFAGGQDEMKGRVFRVGHMGYFDSSDIIASAAAIEGGLRRKGYKVETGVGVSAAMKMLESSHA